MTEEERMNVPETEKTFPFGRLIVKHLLFIILLTVLCTLLGAGYALLIKKPVYVAVKEVIFVTNIAYEDDDGNLTIPSVRDNMTLAKKYLPTVSKNISTPKFVNAANNIYGDENDLVSGKAIDVKYSEDSLIFQISYTDADKFSAVKKLDAVIKSAANNLPDFVSAAEVTLTPVQNDAKVTEDNGLMKFILIGFALGAVLSIGTVLVIGLLDSTIKSKEELEEITGAHLLAKITDVETLDVNKKN